MSGSHSAAQQAYPRTRRIFNPEHRPAHSIQMTLRRFTQLFTSLLFSGLGLVVVGFIDSGLKHLANKTGAPFQMDAPIPLSLALCSLAAAFLTNLICGLKHGKMWGPSKIVGGRGILSDSGWFDIGVNLVLVVLLASGAFDIWKTAQ